MVIYTGAILVGATVVLDQTGQTTTTSDTGYYSFEGLGLGTWSVTVSYPGYNAGTCTKDITTSSGDWWCSVAMTPGSDPVDTGGGGDDSPTSDDSDPATDDSEAPDRPAPGGEGGEGLSPGGRVPVDQLGCAATPGGGGLLWLAGLLLLRRRRR